MSGTGPTHDGPHCERRRWSRGTVILTSHANLAWFCVAIENHCVTTVRLYPVCNRVCPANLRGEPQRAACTVRCVIVWVDASLCLAERIGFVPENENAPSGRLWCMAVRVAVWLYSSCFTDPDTARRDRSTAAPSLAFRPAFRDRVIGPRSGPRDQKRSIMIAGAIPPAAHIVTRPRFRFRRSSSSSTVPIRIEPVAPIG